MVLAGQVGAGLEQDRAHICYICSSTWRRQLPDTCRCRKGTSGERIFTGHPTTSEGLPMSTVSHTCMHANGLNNYELSCTEHPGNDPAGEYFTQVKGLIEETFERNNQTQVVLVCHR